MGMFKKYRMTWKKENEEESYVDFFVNSKKTRNGFMHRACVIGPLPRLDDMGTNYTEYRLNEDVLLRKRFHKVSYVGRTWEAYSGQTCLSGLWTQISKLKFVDMSRISDNNPFSLDYEPEHEDLWEPEDLFDRFKKR